MNSRLLLAAVLCALVAAPLSAEAADPMVYGKGNPADWPRDKDAVLAAPKNHKVLLENDKVRVLDVTVSPGEVEAVHSHRWPSVLYVMAAGDFIDRDANGKVIFDTRTLPSPLTFPLTMYKEPEAPHSVENLSTTITLHLVRVEMKNQAASGHP
jgi:mannose-6-phosphate isomerase-like protein (cupin superfamily)